MNAYSPALEAVNAALGIKCASAKSLLDAVHAAGGISRKGYADLHANVVALAAEKRGEGSYVEAAALDIAAEHFDPAGNLPGRANIDRHNAGFTALELAAKFADEIASKGGR